jgi:ribosomal protein S6--L-glutamate ligase
MPSTAVLGGPDYVANTLAQLPERALVVKPSFGSGGRDVVTYETRDAAVRALREITRQAHGSIEHHVVQPQATGARRDYRVVVANGKAVAGTQRTAGPGRFTTNGTSSSITPYRSAEIDEIAVAAATAIGLEFTGIDVIEHDGNMVVLEANAWPGLSLTGGVCGVNLAEVLLDVLLDTPES